MKRGAIMKIAFFEIKEGEEEHIRDNLKGHELLFFRETLTAENADRVADVDGISVFIYSRVDPEVLGKLRNLKIAATRSTGFDHINLEECEKRGITVCNVPFYGENTVAEHTFALILSLSRKVHKSYVRTLNDNFSIEGLEGFDLKGKTIGVVGCGHIGLHVARIAKGFGMKVLAFDLHRDEFLSEVIGFDYATMDDIFTKSDIISLHVPYNKYTHHLVNEESFKKMKPAAIIVNTSRGGVIDTDALLKALLDKKIAGAGLDVIEGEELIKEEKELLHKEETNERLIQVMKDLKILHNENVVFTPHNAFNSQEALMRILNTSIQNLIVFEQKKPENLVKLHK
ncbi:hydroxyacid dehydrogenase [Candidatus Woesearchaeota archaeon]|nr:hydroxyacid dehydrogenase [Candidatus Woesearchaeota archaeon]